MLFLVCYAACALTYLLLAGMIMVQARRKAASWLLAGASATTAVWAVANIAGSAAPVGMLALLDLLRAGIWYGVVLHLYHRAVADGRHLRMFIGIGVVLLLAGVAVLASGSDGQAPSLLFGPVPLQLLVAVSQIVLLENLYRGTEAELRWHVGLACVALGSLALYDLLLIGDAVLSHRLSLVLVDGRAIVAVLVAPLLAVSAARNRGWGVSLHASRTAVFHTAALMGSGLLLGSLAAVAELLKRQAGTDGSHWAELAEVALIFSGFLLVAVLLVSASARNRLVRLVSEHFFTYRYDYRREWLRCMVTLADDDGNDPGGLPRRAIRALADVVDSPAGLLLTGEAEQSGLSWSGSWNLPATGPVPPGHPLLQALGALGGRQCLPLPDTVLGAPPLAGVRLWLAVPLTVHGGHLAGCVLLAPPRGPFRLDEEVFSLLGVIAREVTTRLAEQRAACILMETRELRDYGERFAFVAHDIKNVAGQLRLLTANAERHIADPAFQRDMLGTIDASVRKIGNLIRRLDAKGEPLPPSPPAPLLMPVVAAAIAGRPQTRLLPAPAGAAEWTVALAPADLDAVLTHLLNNANTAAGARGSVTVRAGEQDGRHVLDITDDGPGMTPEFIRDELFRPFRSSTAGGSGVGAFQARALLRRGGGDLLVLSQPGRGTTVRLLLPPPPPPGKEAAAPLAVPA